MQVIASLQAPLPDRLWMLAVAAASMLLVSGIAPASLILLYLIWNRRQRLVEDSRLILGKYERFFPYLLLLLIPLISIYRGGTPPHDDLLRHVAASRHGYDYTNLYIGLDASFPHHSMWYGFEAILGLLDRTIGYWSTVYLVQATCYFLSALLALALTKRLLPADTPSRSIWMLVAITAFLLSGLLQRATLARPEAFLSVWAISALVIRPAAWLVLGVLLMPAYWLSIIYLPAVILLQASRTNKVVIAVVISMTFFTFWGAYAGREWIEFFGLLAQWTHSRLASPGEGLPIQAALFNPIFIAAIGAALLRGRDSVWTRQDMACLAVMAWFLLPGQVRYIGTVGPLLIAIALPKIPLTKLSATVKVVVFAVCCMVLQANAPSSTHAQLPDFEIPSSARLLTEFDVPTYLLPSINGGVKTAPAMEFGAVEEGIQRASLALSGQGELDCLVILDHQISHVIERHLKVAPHCLANPTFKNEWRLWHVVK